MAFGTADPLGGDDAPAVGYRYRKWTLGDGVVLVTRCELDGASELKGETVLLSVKALTEFDSKVTGMDWRSKIETQRGAVIATELKNNANKLAKWTCQALLAGVDIMKLGFVSRAHPERPREPLHRQHAILQAQGFRAAD